MDILIGQKPVMDYVMKILSCKNDKSFSIKARGRYISKAVDVWEAYRRKFNNIKEVKFITNSLKYENKYVSEIEISFTLN